MLEILWLVPALPFFGFVALLIRGSRCTRQIAAILGTGPVVLSAVLTSLMTVEFVIYPPKGHAFAQALWTWVDVAGFNPAISFYLDPLSLVMALVVTWVGFLILLYSTWFMTNDDGYCRFFAYMNLFVGSMLALVLADNLLFLYLGWEGVGLCSYLLIGFWYKKEENARAALKAFVVTRIGDAAFAVGLFLIYHNLGTLNIQEALARASDQWLTGSALATAAAALLLSGALGKSAQLPLHTWLPDAMAGPTPVSALIHAATMVTAGVYLIARTNGFFLLAPDVLSLVAIVGAVTLLIAASSAVAQRDIKKVLAYSTMSQVGYMFLALGVSAWIAAILHFMIHAFFKALLFLCAGVVIKALNDEHDISKMGGLRKQMPFIFWTFLIGCSSLSAVPFVTAGFYSKDLILLQVLGSGRHGSILFLAGLAGSLLTSLYSFRLLLSVFLGEAKTKAEGSLSRAAIVPLAALATLAIVGGFVETPDGLGGIRLFTHCMEKSLPLSQVLFVGGGTNLTLLALSSAVSLAGVFLAYLLFLRRSAHAENAGGTDLSLSFRRFFLEGWYFDKAYNIFVVKPFVVVARGMRSDFIDLIYGAVAEFSKNLHLLLSFTQTGRLRWYATVVALGAVIFVGMVMLL